jgi:hypothetical protein
MARSAKFVKDYVEHLPAVGFDAVSNPGVTHMVCYHNDWCNIYKGGDCNCTPEIKLHAEPTRS